MSKEKNRHPSTDPHILFPNSDWLKGDVHSEEDEMHSSDEEDSSSTSSKEHLDEADRQVLWFHPRSQRNFVTHLKARKQLSAKLKPKTFAGAQWFTTPGAAEANCTT